jgi:ubiquitin-protein ligase
MSMMARAIKRLNIEIKEGELDPLPYYTLTQKSPDNILEWLATIQNVPNPDLKDRVFHLEIICPPEYPIKPPKIRFLDISQADLAHLPKDHVSAEGYICVDILNGQWAPSWTIRGLVYAICSFLAA